VKLKNAKKRNDGRPGFILVKIIYMSGHIVFGLLPVGQV